MKLKYIDNINEYDDKIMMFYDFNAFEAKLLSEHIVKLTEGNNSEIKLRDLEFLTQEDCELILKISTIDHGISQVEGSDQSFVCALTIKTYQFMSELIVSFDENTSAGHHWLYNINTPIDFLFSSGGTW